MLPRWHILGSVIASLVLWLIFPWIAWYYIIIFFFSSVLIDFDHYMCAVWKTGKLGLFSAFGYHRKLMKKESDEYKRGIRRKGDFHIFHTVEFHIAVIFICLVWAPVWYIFYGMLFHSVVDLVALAYKDRLYRREFFLMNWMWKKLEKTNKPLKYEQESKNTKQK